MESGRDGLFIYRCGSYLFPRRDCEDLMSQQPLRAAGPIVRRLMDLFRRHTGAEGEPVV